MAYPGYGGAPGGFPGQVRKRLTVLKHRREADSAHRPGRGEERREEAEASGGLRSAEVSRVHRNKRDLYKITSTQLTLYHLFSLLNV